jgi:hypothetical protein
MVECTDLPLTICSEQINKVFITKSSKLTTNKINQKTLIQHYDTRIKEDEDMTYSQFAYRYYDKNDDKLTVLHFVGMNNTPCFPVSASYARSSLILHCPWRDYEYHKMNDTSCITLFYQKMKSELFPRSFKLGYEQAMHRYNVDEHTKQNAMSTVGDDDNSTSDNLNDEDDMLLKAFSTLPGVPSLQEEYTYDQGVNYDWSTRITVCQ